MMAPGFIGPHRAKGMGVAGAVENRTHPHTGPGQAGHIQQVALHFPGVAGAAPGQHAHLMAQGFEPGHQAPANEESANDDRDADANA